MSAKEHCLCLGFKDAKTFSRKDGFGKIKDEYTVVRGTSLEKRPSYEDAWAEIPVETLGSCHVSNVLHVLAGERPVPTFRGALVPGAPQVVGVLEALAQQSYVRITSGVFADVEGRPSVYEREVLQGKKFRKDANLPLDFSKFVLDRSASDPRSELFTWERAMFGMGVHQFRKFMSMAESVLGQPQLSRKMSVLEVLKALRFSGSPQVSGFKEDIGSPWGNLLRTGESDPSGLKSSYGEAKYFMARAVVKTVDRYYSRSGEILVPVSSSDLELFRKGPGCATLLDGGLVTIKGILDMSPMLIAGAAPVVVIPRGI